MGDAPDKMCLCFPWECCVRCTYHNSFAMIPCVCWVLYVDWKVLVLPDDAKKVDGEEKDSLLTRLQGRWQIVYVSGKPSGCCSCWPALLPGGDHTQQEVTGSKVFGWDSPGDSPKGPQGLPTCRERDLWNFLSHLEIYRTPNGQLYIDTRTEGTECTRFAPEEGVVSFRDGYGKIWEWRREPCTPVTLYPVPGLEGAMAPPMGCPRGTPLKKFTSDGTYEWACDGLKGDCSAGLEMGPHPGLVVWKCAEHFNKSNPADCDYMQCDKCKCRCDFDLCNECKTVLEAQPISSHPITSQLKTSQPITNQPTTSQPMWQDQPPSFEEPRPTKEVMELRTHLG